MSISLGRGCTAVAILLAACRYQATPVQMRGEPNDISALAGSWSGDYSSAQSGRGGSIVFTIRAGSDTAFGDVLMTPTARQPLAAADIASRARATPSTRLDLLRVTFVRVTGGRVEGALEPYQAPDCRCIVSTVFRGTLSGNGNTIRGEYETHGANGLRQTGAWSVDRKPER